MILVNKVEIPQDSIFHEMQYHPAETIEEAQFKASRSLIIDELFRQRALQLELIEPQQPLSDEVVDKILETDLSLPVATEDDCLVYYQANLDKFKTFPLIAARHILLKAAPDDLTARDEMRELAEQIIATLQQQPDQFSQLARQYSACPSRETGGELGQISKGQTVPEFESQLQRAEAGLVNFPIETRYGFHVVWIEKKIAGKQLTFDMVRERIETYLNEKVKRKAIAQYIAQRISEAEIEGIDLGVDERQTMQ
jgi:peptidyl-prolyl cis-trans isomerase C